MNRSVEAMNVNRNRNPQSPRFLVERDGTGFIILDRLEIRYTPCSPGTSRVEAEQQCVALNSHYAGTALEPTYRRKRGAINRSFLILHRKGNDPDEGELLGERAPPETLARMARELGVTVPALLADSSMIPVEMRQRYARDHWYPPVTLSADVAEAVRTCKDWLPDILRTWANDVAGQQGYGGERRSDWAANMILSLLDDELLEFRDVRVGDLYAALDKKLRSPRLTAEARENWTIRFEKQIRTRLGPPTIAEQVHAAVVPSPLTWQLYDDGDAAARLLRFLCVHYMSGEIADQKAAAFGLQRRSYLMRVSEAHELVAPQIHEIRPIS